MPLAAVFAPVEAIAPAPRFALVRLLHDGTGMTPLLADEVGRLPIPTTPERQRRVGHVLRDALTSEVLDRLAGATLADISPAIASASGRVDSAPGATNRLIALVRSNGDRRWSRLASMTIGDFRSWYGAGPALVGRLLAAAVEAAMVVATEASCSRPQLDVLTARPANAAVCLLDTALAAVDHRARVAVEQVDLLLAPSADVRRTPPFVAAQLGLSYERVRQLRALMLDSLRAAGLAEPIASLARQLALELGEAVTVTEIDRALAALDLPRSDDPAGLLAVWFAGPDRPVPGHAGWFSPDPAALVAHTRALLEASGGVHVKETLCRDLGGLGITDSNVAAWVEAQPLRVVHDLAVVVSGGAAQRAERALEANGAAMTVDELADWMEPDRRAGLAFALSRDRRFVRTGSDRWELAEWGTAPDGGPLRFEISVDDDVLLGAEGPLPVTLAEALGLRPGRVSRFATRFGPLALSYDGGRAKRGSVRPIALASGAVAGSQLTLWLTPGLDRAEVELAW